jgi:hypothetical protein
MACASGSVTAIDAAHAFNTGAPFRVVPQQLEPAWTPLRDLRRSMADAMAVSRDQVMPAPVHDDCDIGAWREPKAVL